MKASETEKFIQIRSGFGVSRHKFLNQLSKGLRQRVAETIPDLILSDPTGKSGDKGKISFTLTGQITFKETKDMKSVDKKVRQLMDSLKNPSNLLSLLQ